MYSTLVHLQEENAFYGLGRVSVLVYNYSTHDYRTSGFSTFLFQNFKTQRLQFRHEGTEWDVVTKPQT
jgi:hypothetical protein